MDGVGTWLEEPSRAEKLPKAFHLPALGASKVSKTGFQSKKAVAGHRMWCRRSVTTAYCCGVREDLRARSCAETAPTPAVCGLGGERRRFKADWARGGARSAERRGGNPRGRARGEGPVGAARRVGAGGKRARPIGRNRTDPAGPGARLPRRKNPARPSREAQKNKPENQRTKIRRVGFSAATTRGRGERSPAGGRAIPGASAGGGYSGRTFRIFCRSSRGFSMASV